MAGTAGAVDVPAGTHGGGVSRFAGWRLAVLFGGVGEVVAPRCTAGCSRGNTGSRGSADRLVALAARSGRP